MKNLLKNWRWLEGDCNGPRCFSIKDANYDDNCFSGCRTCSFTREACSNPKTILECRQLIPSNCRRKIRFGLNIRATEADCLVLVVEAIDCRGVVVSIETKDISKCVSTCFRNLSGEFCIPRNASCLRLSLTSKGSLSACTVFAPYAYFSC